MRSLGSADHALDRRAHLRAVFLSFPFAIPGRSWPLVAAWAFVALADGIYSVAAPAALYGTIPRQGAHPAYFALYNIVSLGAFALGGTIAVPVIRLFQQADWHLGPATLGGCHLYYAACGVAMLLCTAAVALVPARRADRRVDSEPRGAQG